MTDARVLAIWLGLAACAGEPPGEPVVAAVPAPVPASAPAPTRPRAEPRPMLPAAAPAEPAEDEALEDEALEDEAPEDEITGDDEDSAGIEDRDEHHAVLDQVDRCPDDPEDLDGFADDDGCPDPDIDVDPVLDVDEPSAEPPGPYIPI